MHVNAPKKMRSKGDFKIFILPTHQFQAVDSAASKESIAEPGNQKIFISKKEQRNWDESLNVLDMENIKNFGTAGYTFIGRFSTPRTHMVAEWVQTMMRFKHEKQLLVKVLLFTT